MDFKNIHFIFSINHINLQKYHPFIENRFFGKLPLPFLEIKKIIRPSGTVRINAVFTTETQRHKKRNFLNPFPL
jgi:hypothetical protein